MSLGFQVGVSSRSSTSHFIFFTSRNSTNSPLVSTVNYFGGESMHWLLFDSRPLFCVPKVAGHQIVGEREIVNGTEEKLNPSDVQWWGGAVLTFCQLRTAFGQDW